MCERLLREAIKKNTELEKELEFYKNYIEKLDNLNAKDFIFKHELEENYVPKAEIRYMITELEGYKSKLFYVKSYVRDCEIRIEVLKKLLGDENE